MIRTICLIAALTLAHPPTAGAQQELDFYDDFQGSSLNPVFRVLNPDKQRMALTQGEYLLLVTHADTKNVIEYTGTLPADYAVTVRVDQPPQNPRQWMRLRIGPRDSNVRAGMLVDGYSHVIFRTGKTLGGEDASPIEQKNDAMLGEPFYLRITKIGVEYEGAYSTDGVKWTGLGKQVLIDPSARIYLEVASYGDGAESPVRIDSFEITEILN